MKMKTFIVNTQKLKNMKIKSYLYVKGKTIIKIKAKQQPSFYTQRPSGTWVVNELYCGIWMMPCFPEITWGTLKSFIYLGQLMENPDNSKDLQILIKKDEN